MRCATCTLKHLELLIVLTRHYRITFLFPDCVIMEDRSIVVEGLSTETTTAKLATQFQQFGNIEKSAMVLGMDNKPTGKAYVVYTSKNSVRTAMQQFSEENVTVRPVSSTDHAEFCALIPEESPLEALLLAFQALSATDQAALFAKLNPGKSLEFPKAEVSGATADGGTVPVSQLREPSSTTIKQEPGIVASAPASLSGQSHSGNVFHHADGPIVLHEEPKLPYFSGSGKECTFGRWKYEVNCLQEDGNYLASAVTTAVRKSLRSPAADILCRLGIGATSSEIVHKLESIYGSVQSAETLLERFYSEPQLPKNETCAQWSCRLEDLIYQAAGKGAIERSAVPKHLKTRFWSGLRDKRIKDALRSRVDSLTFEELLSEARILEEEYSPEVKSDAVLHQVTEPDSMMKQLFQKIAKMETQLEQLQKQQQKQTKPKNQPSHSGSKESKDGIVKCEKCDQQGHLTFGCRQGANVTCYKCHAAGHIAKAFRNAHATLNSQ